MRGFLLILVLGFVLVACARKPPTRPDSEPSTPKAAAAEAAKTPAPKPLSVTASKRLEAIKNASGKAVCSLATSVDSARDNPILGPVLEIAFKRRRNETEQGCFFDLLTAMKANESLLDVARTATTEARWLAVVGWGSRNLRAKHYPTYILAMARPETSVRVAAITAVGRHSVRKEGLALLKAALKDNVAEVRLKAVAAADEMDDPRADEALKRRRPDETDKAVQAAIDRRLKR